MKKSKFKSESLYFKISNPILNSINTLPVPIRLQIRVFASVMISSVIELENWFNEGRVGKSVAKSVFQGLVEAILKMIGTAA